MKTISLALFSLAICLRGVGQVDVPAVESEWPIIAGEYEVIGRLWESDKTYAGTVSIVEVEDGFRVTRRVGGTEVIGSGKVEFVTPDRLRVFRMRFVEEGKEMLGTFIFGPDLDNDGRLSGYVVPVGYRGDRPGKEVLFTFKEGEKRPNQTSEGK